MVEMFLVPIVLLSGVQIILLCIDLVSPVCKEGNKLNCSNCRYFGVVEGQMVCTYAQNREVDNEGFYIDELPCERGE